MSQEGVPAKKNKLFNYNLVLIGFMGAGKSTVSDYFHTRYGMDVIEMDEIIARREGMSITDMVKNTSATARPISSSRCSLKRTLSSPAAEASQ